MGEYREGSRHSLIVHLPLNAAIQAMSRIMQPSVRLHHFLHAASQATLHRARESHMSTRTAASHLSS